MQNILAPFLWIFTLVYIDNIVIFSKTFDDHLNHLDQVCKVVAKTGIMLAMTKCHFTYQSLLLLGQKVSRLRLSTHGKGVGKIKIGRTQKYAQFTNILGYDGTFLSIHSILCLDCCTPL
jgi:hypothetical protein